MLAFVGGASLPPTGTFLAAGAVGFLGYGVSLALFVLALRHLGAARTGAYFSLAPFVGATLAVVMLGDPVSARADDRRRPDGVGTLAAPVGAA